MKLPIPGSGFPIPDPRFRIPDSYMIRISKYEIADSGFRINFRIPDPGFGFPILGWLLNTIKP
jgi:hypothetical protein